MKRQPFLAVLALGFGSACGEFAHTNPYDPAVPMTLTIDGPDTVTRFIAPVQFTYRSTPEVPGGFPTWSSNPALALEPVGSGLFRPLSNETVTITVSLAGRTASKRVVIQQKLDRFLICPSCNTIFGSRDAARTFPLVPVDAATAPILVPIVIPSPVTAVSRDTTIASAGLVGTTGVVITPRRAGTTRVVVAVGARADSTTIDVRP